MGEGVQGGWTATRAEPDRKGGRKSPAGRKVPGAADSSPCLPSTGHYMKTPCTEPCGDSFCLPCSQGSFLTRDGHFKTECTRCQVCDEEGEGLAARGSGQAREDRPSLWLFRQLSWMRGLSVQSTTPGWGVPFFPLWPSCLPGPPPLVHHEQLTSTLLSRLARGLSQGGCPLLLCSSQ